MSTTAKPKDLGESFADLIGGLAHLFETRALVARSKGRERIGDEIGQRFLTRANTYDEAAREARQLERKLRNDELPMG